MPSIAICDDTPTELAAIVDLTGRYVAAHAPGSVLESFSHPYALLEAASKDPFDIYLLDVIMPMQTGIDVARELRHDQPAAQFVFLTTSDEYAVDAFELHAAHYLRKPFNDAQFGEAMDRAMQGVAEAAPTLLTVRTDGGALRMLEVDDIQFIESRGHAQRVTLSDGEVVVETRRSLARLLEELEKVAPGQFVLPYKGYVVNQRAIVTIDSSDILLRCGARVPVPRGAMGEIQARYVAYRFGQGRTS